MQGKDQNLEQKVASQEHINKQLPVASMYSVHKIPLNEKQ